LLSPAQCTEKQCFTAFFKKKNRAEMQGQRVFRGFFFEKTALHQPAQSGYFMGF
jgi:hypothetical protein